MPNWSYIGKIIVTASAALGGVLAILQLGDRFDWDDNNSPVPAADNSIAVMEPLVWNPDTKGPAVEESDGLSQTRYSKFEQKVVQRFEDQLAINSCGGLKIREIALTTKQTPAAKSVSGFEGFFLEGTVVLLAGEAIIKARLVGTGKGPNAENSAIDMAIRQVMEQTTSENPIQVMCNGDN